VSRSVTRFAIAGGVTALLAGVVAATPSQAASHGDRSKHVLLISVDGLHQSDLAWYVRQYPGSALAKLVRGGVDYSGASAPVGAMPGVQFVVPAGSRSWFQVSS
jgi:hypothetical protein